MRNLLKRFYQLIFDLKLIRQLLFVFTTVLVVNLVAGAYFTKKIRDLKELVEVVYDQPLMSSTYAMSAKYRFQRVDSMVRTALYEKDPEKFKRLRKLIDDEIDQGQEDLIVVEERAVSASSKEIAKAVDQKVAEYETQVVGFLERAEEDLERGRSLFEVRQQLAAYDENEVRNFIQSRLTDLTDDAADAGYTFRLESEQQNDKTVKFFYFVSGLMVLVTLLLAGWLFKSIALPLVKYSEVCLEIAKGHYKKRIRVFGEKSEIALLGRSFNFMLEKVDEKDRNMKSLLDGLGTGVFSFNQEGQISREKSQFCAQIFPDHVFTDVFHFFETYAGMEKDVLEESVALLWNPDLDIGFGSLINGIFPTRMTWPLNDPKPKRYITLSYKQNLNAENKLEKVIVLAEDVTEATLSQQDALKQAERVERLTKASQSTENYLESQNNIKNLLRDVKSILLPGLAKAKPAEILFLKRQLHSLKGEFAIMGHGRCSKQVHEIETRVDEGRNGGSDQFFKDLILSNEKDFVIELEDVLAVLGIDEQNAAVKISREKIDQLFQFVRTNTTLTNDQKQNLFDQLQHLMRKSLRSYFVKFENYVKVLSTHLHKPVRLEFDPQSDEVAANEIQNLDALFGHLIRNCMDHGIEDESTRRQVGKEKVGRILLSVQRDAEQHRLVIKMKDDGRGIDHRVLVEKAVQKKIWTTEQAAKATREQALDLIFQSDFSTKEVVTEISGRGVGLDAVKFEVESRGGKLSLQTEISKGTEFTIELPY